MTNADLSGANLRGFTPTRLIWKNADLRSVTNYDDVPWKAGANAWWEASHMGADLLGYLSKNAPYDAKLYYGPNKISESEYQEAVARLGHN